MAKKTQNSGQMKKGGAGGAQGKTEQGRTDQRNAPQPQAVFTEATETAVPHVRAGVTNRQSEATRRVMGGAVVEPPRKSGETVASWPFWAGIGLTAAWFAAVFFATMDANATGQIAGLPITSIALGISGVIAPVAFLWMIIAYLQRASDVRAVTEPLRRQLQMVLGTGASAESRVRRFNEVLERQLELLRQAGDGSYDVLQSAVQVLQEEERAIGQLAERSGKEIQRVAGIVRDNSEVLEDLLHDNRERFTDLSGKIAGHIATLDEKADAAAQRLGDMVDRLYGLIDQFKAVADQKMADCASMTDQIGRQERDTEEAARRMNETLQAARLSTQELSTVLLKNQDLLDQSGQKLLARMQEINGEIESFAASADAKDRKLSERGAMLSQTLTREIGALEALTGRLEAQIGAANDAISARTGEFEMRQQKLVQEAGSLIQNLSGTVKDIDETAQVAFQKFGAMSEGLAEQSGRVTQQFQVAGSHYDAMAEKLDGVSRNVAERVNVIGRSLSQQVESIAGSSDRAREASEAASGSAGEALNKLEVMIARIFDAEQRAREGAENVVQSMEGRFSALVNVTDQHMARLNATHDRFEEVGTRLAERAREAEGTWQSLAEAAKNQQESLQEQLRAKVEAAVGLLNENAHAIEAARDSLYAHVEAGFAKGQEMIDALTMLGEAVDAPFSNAAIKVRAAVEEGQQQLQLFTGTLEKNAQLVAGVNQRLAQESEQAGHRAAEALAGLDAIAARMEAIQHAGTATSEDVLLRLSGLAQQVEGAMQRLSGTASDEQKKLAETVRELSLDINGLIHDSQTADQRLRIAATLLSDQAADVRGKLEAQAKGIETSLSHLNDQFSVMADQMRATTTTAQSHISEITARYNDITHMSKEGLQEKIESLGHVVRGAAETLAGLGENIETRTQQLTQVQGQLQAGTRGVDDATQQALDRLSVFTHALTAVRGSAGEAAQDVFARLQDVQNQFTRQISAVSEGSDTIAETMRRAVGSLVEQSVGLAAASQQAEARIESLAANAQALQGRAHDVRAAIDQEAAAMQARMETVLSSIEAASVGMERNAVIAFDRTEGMAKRFAGISETAFARLGEAATEIEKVSGESVARVETVNKALMEQVANLTFAGEHIAEVDSEVRRSARESTGLLNRLASEVGATAAFAADQLRQQVAGLKQEADGLLKRFDAVGTGLAHQSLGVMDIADRLEQNLARLRETAMASYEDAYAVGQRIVGSTIEFKNEISGAVQNMAASGEALQQRGEFAITMVHQMAGRFTEATQTLRTQFEAEAEHLQKVASETQQRLGSFNGSLAENHRQLQAVSGQLSQSGRDVGELLEKANFLLRGAGTQIDRLKGSAHDVATSLTTRLGDMLTAFESELKGMSANASISLDELNAKARAMSMQMREEAQAAADNILVMMHEMRSEAEENFRGLAENAGEAVSFLREEGRDVAQGLHRDTERTLVSAGEHMAQLRLQTAEMQNEFRSSLMGMVELVVGNLKQVQDSGAAVAEAIRNGARTGSGEALEVLQNLRRVTEQDVRSILGVMENTLSGLSRMTERLKDEMKAGSNEAQRAALQSFAVLRQQIEGEMRQLSSSAEAALGQLNGTCGLLTDEMSRVVGEAQNATAQFEKASQRMREEAGGISGSVAEVTQGLAATTGLMQRSQSALYDIAQKSAETLGVFNESIAKNASTLSAIHQDFMGANDNIVAADERLALLKKGLGNAMTEMVDRVNTGLIQLGQQILKVKAEAGGAVESMSAQSDAFAASQGTVVHTVQALAQALSQLEAVNHTLAHTIQNSTQEAAQQTRQLGALSQQVQQQVATLENAAQAAAHQSVALSQSLDMPIAKVENLTERLDRTLNLTVMVGDKIAGQLGGMTRDMERALHDMAGGAKNMVSRTYASPEAETAQDMLGRLQNMAQHAAAPVARAPAYVPPAPSYVPAAPLPAPAARKSDSDLISSLSQIIQQLEESTGKADAAARKKVS